MIHQATLVHVDISVNKPRYRSEVSIINIGYNGLCSISINMCFQLIINIVHSVLRHLGCHHFKLGINKYPDPEILPMNSQFDIQFTKEINAAAWSSFGKYRVTKIGCCRLFDLNCIIVYLCLDLKSEDNKITCILCHVMAPLYLISFNKAIKAACM